MDDTNDFPAMITTSYLLLLLRMSMNAVNGADSFFKCPFDFIKQIKISSMAPAENQQ